MISRDTLNPAVMTLGQRFWQLNWFLILLICTLYNKQHIEKQIDKSASYGTLSEGQPRETIHFVSFCRFIRFGNHMVSLALHLPFPCWRASRAST